MNNWADRLIIQYENGRKGLSEMKNDVVSNIEHLTGEKPNEIDLETKEQINLYKEDRKQINSMIRDMSYCIDWLKTGKEPGSLRGIDRRSIYQRRVLADMDLFPSLDIHPEDEELTNDDKQAIYNILSSLSVRERQCFILHNAYQLSMSEVGNELNISKSTVQKYIDRAKEKINKRILSYDCRTVAT